jgi:hypothetical protein
MTDPQAEISGCPLFSWVDYLWPRVVAWVRRAWWEHVAVHNRMGRDA